jgi:hypothetical protein
MHNLKCNNAYNSYKKIMQEMKNLTILLMVEW